MERTAALALVGILAFATMGWGQALSLRARFRRVSRAPDLAMLVELAEPRWFPRHGNAVLVKRGTALTVAHCVLRPGCHLVGLTVGGQPATVIAVHDELALVRVSAELDAVPAALPPTWDPGEVSEGERLIHRYYSRGSRRVEGRSVTWQGTSHVREGFVPGMSGSGLFTAGGRLVGLAESGNGFAHGLLDLVTFLRPRGPGWSA